MRVVRQHCSGDNPAVHGLEERGEARQSSSYDQQMDLQDGPYDGPCKLPTWTFFRAGLV